jgi:DNA modification methylase
MNWDELQLRLIKSKYYYFHTRNGILLCGDSREILNSLPPKSIDLLLTDPPYGCIGVNKVFRYTVPGRLNGRAPRNTYDTTWDVRLDKEFLDLLFKVTKNQIIFGYNYYAGMLPLTNSLIVWDKKERYWVNNLSDGEIIWTSFKKPLRIFRFVWQGAIRRGRKTIRVHPTQKPVELFKWILSEYLKKEFDSINTVLDPFIGSGSTAVACEELNKHWIGIEKNEEYCKLAVKGILTGGRFYES